MAVNICSYPGLPHVAIILPTTGRVIVTVAAAKCNNKELHSRFVLCIVGLQRFTLDFVLGEQQFPTDALILFIAPCCECKKLEGQVCYKWRKLNQL